MMKSVPYALAIAAAAISGAAQSITLTQISTTFNTPIGIDYHEPTQSVIASVNYAGGGSPYNLERILQDGSHTQFSSVSGLTDELKIATVRSGNLGGFTTGEVFTGTGGDGEIIRIAANGASSINPWVSLPGSINGLLRGSLYVDRTGVYGGDLLGATTAGQVWRITSGGVATMLADVGEHLEGLLSVPDNSAQYGPLAGKIIAGAEGSGRMYVFDNGGLVDTLSLGVNIEDIDLIEPNENFFGVNYGSSRILGAPASEFASMAGDILLTQEMHGGSGLYRLAWDGTTLSASELTLGSGSEIPSQWEHVTFAPAGIVEINPTVPETSTWISGVLLSLGAVGTYLRRRA